MAIFGKICSPLTPDLKFFLSSFIRAPFVTSETVPAVVGIATRGKDFCFFATVFQ